MYMTLTDVDFGTVWICSNNRPEGADMILNTRYIREKPGKSIPNLADCANSKSVRVTKGRQITIAVAGCVAQAEGAYRGPVG